MLGTDLQILRVVENHPLGKPVSTYAKLPDGQQCFSAAGMLRVTSPRVALLSGSDSCQIRNLLVY